MSKKEKLLYPIFLTPQENVFPFVGVPVSLIPTKIQTTKIRTIPRSIATCEYLSFEQLYPKNSNDGLSWVISPNPGQEVIQFLAYKANFKIEWKLKAVADLTGRERVRLLLPDLTEERAYEPWDVNGNEIKFCIPRYVGDVTRGSFVIPGVYGQFIIQSPGDSLVMNMKVKFNNVRDPDPYYYSPLGKAFCLCDKNGCEPAYVNKSVNNFITREVYSKYIPLQEKVKKIYRFNPGYPCFPLSLRRPLAETSTEFIVRGNLLEGNNFDPYMFIPETSTKVFTSSTDLCDKFHSEFSTWPVPFQQNDVSIKNIGQFILNQRPSRIYRVRFNIEANGPSYNQAKEAFGNQIPDGTISSLGTPCDSLFQMLNPNKQPAAYDPTVSRLPPNVPPIFPKDRITIKLTQTIMNQSSDPKEHYVKFSFSLNQNQFFELVSTGILATTTYSFAITNIITKFEFEDQTVIYVPGAWNMKVTTTITTS